MPWHLSYSMSHIMEKQNSIRFPSYPLITRAIGPCFYADANPRNENITEHFRASPKFQTTSFPCHFIRSFSLIKKLTFAGSSNAASQADVACFKALSVRPDAAKQPDAARWWAHIASYEADFATLPGDASKPYTAYGPEVVAAAEKENDEVDLFGSDDEEDSEAARVREERVAAYKEKKAAKPKAAAKSVVIMDVKPWGAQYRLSPLLGV